MFRICCFLEGLETAEKRLGWSARSGKVVLKIALERLALHYGLRAAAAAPRGESHQPAAAMIAAEVGAVSEAPPTSAPSTFSTAKISAALPGLTEPP